MLSCSSFLRRSWSLKSGFLGAVVVVAVVVEVAVVGRWWRREGRVRGSLWVEGSSEAPVSFWTTARKLEGSAWTKVVLGVVGVVGSGTKEVGEWRVVVELEEAMREREREREISGRDWRVEAGREGMKCVFYSLHTERERERE